MHLQAFTLLLPLFVQHGVNARRFNEIEVDITVEQPKHDQALFRAARACPTGVHVIAVRATTEAPGMGIMHIIVDQVLAKIDDSDAMAIDYPASGIEIIDGKAHYNMTEYIRSMMIGVDHFKAEMESFTSDCPDSKIVIMGYSQGAHVLGTGLCGALGTGLFPYSQALESNYTSKLNSILQFGDPTNKKGLPWHAGTGKKSGRFARKDFTACQHLGGSWLSYCDKGDLFCDEGFDIKIHKEYVEHYGDVVVDYIVKNALGTDESPILESDDSYEL